LHPEYPFIHPLKFQFGEFPEELKWLLWYLTHLFHIGVEFFIPDLQHFLIMAIQDEISPEMKNLANFFKWFYHLEQWADMIMFEFLKNTRVQWILIIFYKPQYFIQNGPATQQGAFPSAWIHKTYFSEVSLNKYDYKDLQKYLCQINKVIPSEIWPSEKDLAPWDIDKDPLTTYQQQLKEALKEYHSNISDPNEWSQEYPIFYSQIMEDTPAWKDVHEDKPPDDLEERIEQLELKCYEAREEKKRKIEELNINFNISTDYDTD
ncbi:hypothetical protein Goklo_027293, partial [Gossypium klotzschianum]|nr:hypothetical protein [Gossypium klotzschianum]